MDLNFRIVIVTPRVSDLTQRISFTDVSPVGQGSFGEVYKARIIETNECVAIKKVLQDQRFKNRELHIMRPLHHCNIVSLLYFFYTNGPKKDEVYLNLVLEYIPDVVHRVSAEYFRNRQCMPFILVKVFAYQMLRGLGYLHSLGICHRDVKPHNLLVDSTTAVLKLCDFGSAKLLNSNEANVSYICSRFYRAPELIFGATNYSCQIDIWSAGCVLAELLLGQPLFPGDCGVDQLVEIIKVLGTPNRDQIHAMNPSYAEFQFPLIRTQSWSTVFHPQTPSELVDLVAKLLIYIPHERLTPLQSLLDPCFNELKRKSKRLPNGNSLPPLFNFTEQEILMSKELKEESLSQNLSTSAE